MSQCNARLSSEHGLQWCVVFVQYMCQLVLVTVWYYVCVCVSVDWLREDVHYGRSRGWR